jgi:Tfp pilus assembly protein PilE
MAGRKLIKTKVTASTILEVIIAMVIIILVFGIAMMIYTNVLRVSLSVKKIQAQAVLKETLFNAEKTNNYTSQSIIIRDFRVEEEVKSFGDDTTLKEIHLRAFDSNQQQITELQKVILR